MKKEFSVSQVILAIGLIVGCLILLASYSMKLQAGDNISSKWVLVYDVHHAGEMYVLYDDTIKKVFIPGPEGWTKEHDAFAKKLLEDSIVELRNFERDSNGIYPERIFIDGESVQELLDKIEGGVY
ncbi:hypothetical protein [Alkalihalobacillus sp. BA299]|uniref:hypothetical protein n=1 Tax=Alkalihalobacillus sp. BA299 TaxID=2815938 RepID=UPI001ADA1E53|nr:hypothetical protein [Alkalihalobacillus sp. BA299]